MSKPITRLILIVSPTSAGIVPQFGDAAVEARITQALERIHFEVANLDFDDFPDLSRKLAEVEPRTIVMPNGIRTEPDASSPFLASLLDSYGIAYVGSDAVGMASISKIWNKHLLRARGVPTLPHAVFPGPEAAGFIRSAFQPLVMKPEFGANSEGVIRVEPTAAALSVAEELYAKYGQRILIEPWAREREYTVALLETAPQNIMAIPLEILLEEGDLFLSRDVKLYRVAGTHRRLTDPDRRVAVCSLARDAFKACHLRDLARIDLLEVESGGMVVIDVNPHPGFKPGPGRPSYFPAAFAIEKQWSYEDVVLALIARCAERTGFGLPPAVSERFEILRGR